MAPPSTEAPAVPAPVANELHIPEDRTLQLQAAFPQIFSPGTPIKRLDDWVWTPACSQPAFGEVRLPPDRSPLAPCARVRDVILAEELTSTLTGMNTERQILEWLLKPVGWLDPTRPVVEPVENQPVESTPVADTSVAAGGIRQPPAMASTRLAASRTDASEDRCPPLPAHLPDRTIQTSLVRDTPVMNHIFLTIVCHQLPMPTVLPPPLQNMLDMPFKAQLTLDVLNTYVLALLFGLLGASVHIMRDIHRRLDDFTLTRVLLSRYKTRLILGAVAGPFIGLFVNPLEGVTSSLNATPPQLATHLTGLGLAFLAGFSVEVLFSALDRLTTLLSAVSAGGQSGATTSTQRVSGTSMH